MNGLVIELLFLELWWEEAKGAEDECTCQDRENAILR